MNRQGPIVIIEDDAEDRELLTLACHEIGRPNKLKFFADGVSAYEYLTETADRPFLIISDVTMPGMTGFELRARLLDEMPPERQVPHIFLTNGITPSLKKLAYTMGVQGLFQKPDSYPALVQLLTRLLDYWEECISP
jgi:CheY-like chemotaxis protein